MNPSEEIRDNSSRSGSTIEDLERYLNELRQELENVGDAVDPKEMRRIISSEIERYEKRLEKERSKNPKE